MNPAECDWWRRNAHTLESIAATIPESRTLTTADGTVLLNGQRVSPALFTIQNVKPLAGRGLYADEERSDAHVVVLGASTWQRYFGADPQIVNRTVTLDGESYTVVGVMPGEFGPQAFWMPYAVEPPRAGSLQLVQVSCLLKSGVAIKAAAEEVNALGSQLRSGAGSRPAHTTRFDVVGEQDEMTAAIRLQLRVLVVSVIVVLLVVCVNVANLLLVRGAGRHREIGIRRALGARRSRIFAQLLTEGVVLSLAGGVVGTVMAYGGIHLVKTLSVINIPGRYLTALGPLGATILPRGNEVDVDLSVLVFAVGISLLTGAAFAFAPAIRLLRVGDGETLGASDLATRSATTREGNRVGHILAGAQIGLATALLIASGLLVHSFLNLSTLFLGFDPASQVFQLVSPREYPRSRKLDVAYNLTSRLHALPGVQAAGFINMPPLSTAGLQPNLYLPPEWESQRESLGDEYRTNIRAISGDYLRAIGVRLLEGRWLSDHDTASQTRVMLVKWGMGRTILAG
jgi:predicted permease